MKHERIYFTCEGCGDDLPEEGHTEVKANFTGFREPTINDAKIWELCSKCWLDVFAVLDRQDSKRRQEQVAASRSRVNMFVGDDERDWHDELRPWDDI